MIQLVKNIIIHMKVIVQNVKKINVLIVQQIMMKIMKKMNFGLKRYYLKKISQMHLKITLKE